MLFIHQLDIYKQSESTTIIVYDPGSEDPEEELEELQKKLEDAKKELEEQLAANIPSTQPDIKNIAVNNNGPLKDDRGTDAEQLYKDAARVQEELGKDYQRDINDKSQDVTEVSRTPNTPNEEPQQPSYSGPSVLSYTLDGRTARSLPSPAYKCYGGGVVTVIIWVDTYGNVVDAKINNDTSAADDCIRRHALEAAEKSKFSRSSTAPEKQVGEIVYQFISQMD